MSSRRRPAFSPQWPFWLLLAAWLCANCPQVAVHGLLTWIADAHSFRHQQRLTLDVALVLTGEKPSRPAAEAIARASDERPVPSVPPVGPDAGIRKIELSLEKTVELLPPAIAGVGRLAGDWSWPDRRRAAPPHAPPRATG